ncbi:glycine--tRNA ligase [Archaeoglobales archaeon ex4484_92]|nr:MAG: glycine--tRNA ligase [Archaeoglobales archaeon ex4484_92]
MSELMEMLIRRGFFWQSFEIYGGLAGFIDYAPLGNNLRRKIENIWRKHFVIDERTVEIDTPTVGLEDVFIASGHVESFADVAIECKKCGKIFRADHYIKEKLDIEVEEKIETVKEVLESYDLRCDCGGEFKEPVPFNLMFVTRIGPGKGKKGYLRPETAQGIFVDFRRLSSFFRDKLPFGVAQIGRAYRNEISPRQGVVRLREFNQAELEYFVNPRDKKHQRFNEFKEEVVILIDKFDVKHKIKLADALEKGIIANEILAYFIGKTKRFLIEVGINEEKLRFRQHKDDERAHYAVDCWDAEVLTAFGWIEVVGIADRSDYDLQRHSRFSGTDLSIFVQYEEPIKIKKKKIIPRMDKIGPKFKERAKLIKEKLESMNVEVPVDLELDLDGEKILIEKEFYEITETEEVVYGEKVIPHVIEPSFGLDRISYAVLDHSFDKDIIDGEERRVLRLKRWVAPVEVAVLPLLSRHPFVDKALEILFYLKSSGFYAEYDDSGSIGRRYRRFDEIGTPFCVTVDHQTFNDSTVTIRDRDTTAQIRIEISELKKVLRKLLNSERDIYEFGKKFR